ncbi:hypothetical protein Taro_011275 [Colocasia esculenta]|uniref:Uncharacterized protein n=1 Tax=Colocasia esculenta TaxID=4460 RepID=A0A843UC50_COLES|nr:hypothetical protein [Colocasia esculenta]
MAHAYEGIGLCRSLSLPPFSRSLPSHISSAPSRSHLSRASSPSHFSANSSLFQPSGLFDGICIFYSSHMGVVSKLYCKIWKKDFTKLHVATKELIFRDLQHFNGKSLDDAIASVPVGVDSSDWQTMCEMWINGDEQETMTQLMAPSSDVDAESHSLVTPEEAFISVMGKDRPGRVRCRVVERH